MYINIVLFFLGIQLIHIFVVLLISIIYKNTKIYKNRNNKNYEKFPLRRSERIKNIYPKPNYNF